MVAVLCYTAFTASTPSWAALLVGICGGLVNVPLLASYEGAVPKDALGNGMALLNTAGYISMAGFSALLAVLARAGIIDVNGQLWLVAGLTGVGCILAWFAYGKHALGLWGPAPTSSAPHA